MTKSDQGIKARLFTYLQVGLKAGDGGGQDEAAVDPQHRDELASAPMAKRQDRQKTRGWRRCGLRTPSILSTVMN